MEESEWLMEFGDNLLTMLSRRGMTQADLAESTGLTKQAISNYVHLKRVPSITAIIHMSYA